MARSARVAGEGEAVSPVVLRETGFIFWFHSYDAIHENRASVHIGKGSPDDYNDAKVWLEPEIEVAKQSRSLRHHELNRALKIIEENHDRLLERWYEHRGETE